MKLEVGTLQDIGAQVGDLVEFIFNRGSCLFIIGSIENGMYYTENKLFGELDSDSPYWRIVSRASKGPVREVTRKEIVPGVYGAVKVHDPGSKYVRINIDDAMDVGDLTAAIATLTLIRDAMVSDL